MTFEQWLEENPKVAALAPSDLRLVQIGWIAGKLDAACERMDEALNREAA